MEARHKPSEANAESIHMGILQIATVGDDPEPILVGVREHAVSRLVLLHTPDYAKNAEEIRQMLAPLKLDTHVESVEGDVMLGVLRVVGALVMRDKGRYDDVYINVSSGTRMTGCAATAAAFAHGVKAFGIMEGKPFFLPILKFSYQELISEAKLSILRAIEEHEGELESLQALSDDTGIDKSLLSYHIRGGRDNKGLENLGLVEIDRGVRGRLAIRLTPMANMLLAGYPTPAVADAASHR